MMRIAALFVLCLAAAASASAQPPRVTPPCDRACLEGFVDRWWPHSMAIGAMTVDGQESKGELFQHAANVIKHFLIYD